MVHLSVPGFLSVTGQTTRFTTQSSSLSFPHRSVLSDLSLRTKVRSFAGLQKGSRLPVRSVVTVNSAATAPIPPSVPTSKGNVSHLEERRAARQARSRPWIHDGSKSVNQSCKGHLSISHTVPKTIPKPIPKHVPKPIPKSAPVPLPITRTAIPAARQTEIRQAIALIGKTLAKPVPRCLKDEPVRKRVRFGETTVIPVSRWIVRRKHIFPFPSFFGHLQGWYLKPLPEPDADGLEVAYKSTFGSDDYIMLVSTHASEDCERGAECSWNTLARIQARHPMWSPPRVFKHWLRKREKMRKQGIFVL
ncbi:hypothetical protein P170DRAFT_431849 [Aspergillus steynii IBT 23096]|uniref:Uncharacterized protein n=1 Tax=Aspergillus steynii IBT 23096 TaxID=1392250 RepID=A0A2I2GMU9_9EURO|nr:uncharacterized protein P170DRAFT_431849 [Aspergillus steynii IBT 23096]PLB54212.1 hypothetical protein P170DRAFT_431849 [Aspergillus steynii IBT 23096]